MEWNEKLQKIIDYIEDHLQRKEEDINIKEIEQIAQCSYSFFQKVFSYMNNITFSEYIRFRKMTLAGYDVKSSSIKIVDLSYKYGYDSPTSFTKAFTSFHGVSPSVARKNGSQLRIYPKMNIIDQQKYSWEIKKFPKIRLIGKKMNINHINNDFHQKIPEFWNQCQRDGTFYKLTTYDQRQPQGLFGIFNQDKEYAIMVASSIALPNNYQEYIIDEGYWAVFNCYGTPPDAILKAWHYLHEEWLIKYPFKHANNPEIEWYSQGNIYDHHYLSQIWIPIIKED